MGALEEKKERNVKKIVKFIETAGAVGLGVQFQFQFSHVFNLLSRFAKNRKNTHKINIDPKIQQKKKKQKSKSDRKKNKENKGI